MFYEKKIQIVAIYFIFKGRNMIEIMGKSYLTEKEASKRYGYSISWFRITRKKNKGEYPKYIKLQGKGRVLYPLLETDQWFLTNLIAI